MRAIQKALQDAELRFPVRIRIGIPPEGLGSRLDQMNAWLDTNCGADAWAITPSGVPLQHPCHQIRAPRKRYKTNLKRLS